MSGGHYDYAYQRVETLASDIQHDAEGDRDIPIDIAAHMVKVAEQLRSVAKNAKEIEWYMSGDHGSNSYRRLVGLQAKPEDD